MKSNFILRLESSIKRAISDIINFEVKNNIGLVTITDCDLTTDLEYLTVYYTVLSENDKKRAREGLEGSKGFIRGALSRKVQMRKTPQIVFKYDESYSKGSRIDELLESIKKNEMPN